MIKNFLVGLAVVMATVSLTRQLALSGEQRNLQLAQSNHGASHSHGAPAAKKEAPSAKKAAEPAKASALQPAGGAKIKIITPSKNQVFTGDKIPLEYSLTKGKRGHHAHAYVDGELMGMFDSAKGTLNGIKPGKHVLELRVVTGDHQTELDATDKVEFTVK